MGVANPLIEPVLSTRDCLPPRPLQRCPYNNTCAGSHFIARADCMRLSFAQNWLGLSRFRAAVSVSLHGVRVRVHAPVFVCVMSGWMRSSGLGVVFHSRAYCISSHANSCCLMARMADDQKPGCGRKPKTTKPEHKLNQEEKLFREARVIADRVRLSALCHSTSFSCVYCFVVPKCACTRPLAAPSVSVLSEKDV